MKFTELKLKGSYLIEIDKKKDFRGFFARTFCKYEFEEFGLDFKIIQSNISYNKKQWTLRGLHYQTHPFEEIKIVSCTKGKIFDVIIDLRKKSKTFLKWVNIELSEDNYKMVYIPKGFAHGFLTLKENCIVNYQMSKEYNPDHANGIRWNDKNININWPKKDGLLMSKKDSLYPDYNE
jgi:dTDP-4-dehydrorhamnose 3,5-epimerase